MRCHWLHRRKLSFSFTHKNFVKILPLLFYVLGFSLQFNWMSIFNQLILYTLEVAMAQFIAFDPAAEVSGASILSVVAALGEDIRDLLAEYGITDITPDSWYPQQAWLDAFREIAQGDLDNMFDLVNVGIQTPQNAFWPAELQSVEEALQSLNEAYHMNHRGGEIGYYEAIPLEDGGVKVICENPYPCDFDYGLIYGVAKMYAPPDAQVIVEHDPEGPCRKNGDDACIYYAYVE